MYLGNWHVHDIEYVPTSVEIKRLCQYDFCSNRLGGLLVVCSDSTGKLPAALFTLAPSFTAFVFSSPHTLFEFSGCLHDPPSKLLQDANPSLCGISTRWSVTMACLARAQLNSL